MFVWGCPGEPFHFTLAFIPPYSIGQGIACISAGAGRRCIPSCEQFVVAVLGVVCDMSLAYLYEYSASHKRRSPVGFCTTERASW